MLDWRNPQLCTLKSIALTWGSTSHTLLQPLTGVQREPMTSWLWLEDSLTVLLDSLSITVYFQLLSPILPPFIHLVSYLHRGPVVPHAPNNPSSLLIFPHQRCPYLAHYTADPSSVLVSASSRTQANTVDQEWDLRKQANRRLGAGSSPTRRVKRMTPWSVSGIHLCSLWHNIMAQLRNTSQMVCRKVNIAGLNLVARSPLANVQQWGFQECFPPFPNW